MRVYYWVLLYINEQVLEGLETMMIKMTRIGIMRSYGSWKLGKYNKKYVINRAFNYEVHKLNYKLNDN